ncbi:hypothetical protein EDB86DRAFT_2834624 [Lactarius hatsudake]|nr:hypothetical protein EDB86DRAFT_2834624 [Lactarius hatsudake]
MAAWVTDVVFTAVVVVVVAVTSPVCHGYGGLLLSITMATHFFVLFGPPVFDVFCYGPLVPELPGDHRDGWFLTVSEHPWVARLREDVLAFTVAPGRLRQRVRLALPSAPNRKTHGTSAVVTQLQSIYIMDGCEAHAASSLHPTLPQLRRARSPVMQMWGRRSKCPASRALAMAYFRTPRGPSPSPPPQHVALHTGSAGTCACGHAAASWWCWSTHASRAGRSAVVFTVSTMKLRPRAPGL